jgi:hypothetical protein
LLRDFDVEAVEMEEETALAGDVILQARCDAVLRRKSDGRLFIYNLKTASSPDSQKWQQAWETNQQVMLETLAVERRLGEKVYGVIIDGFNKGQRAPVWWDSLKEIREGGNGQPSAKWEAQRSRLLYGYKCEGNPPLSKTMYDFVGTVRKGWGKFAVWEEGHGSGPFVAPGFTPIYLWVHWLPEEEVESAFVTLPPIMRTEEAVASKVRQVVGLVRRIEEGRYSLNQEQLDYHFPQNDRACHWPSKCAFYGICHEGAQEQPEAYGFVERKANHPEEESNG